MARCIVTLAPDYPLQRAHVMRLVVCNERRGFTLAGYEPGHLFMRLTIDGAAPPTFKRKADAIAWAQAKGLHAAQRVRRGRRNLYPPRLLDAASPVATRHA